MTKYGKTKKLMKEAGISKNEAKDFLRRSGWNYEEAKKLWAFSKLPEINFEKIFDGLAEAVQKLTEKLPEIIQELTANLAPIIQKIGEAAASGVDEATLRKKLGITSEKGGDEE